jgi:AcrR family transcriptional regulator
MSDERSVSCDTAAQAGRFAAGEDPVKREQILDGSKRVFMSVGFDAASMNDITREAGVSKSTIYVYFANKDELFAAIMERERMQLAQSLLAILSGIEDVEEGLFRYGVGFALQLTAVGTVSAMRTMIAVAARMPQLSGQFFQDETLNVRTVLEHFLEQQVVRGTLRIDDIPLAARQYIELCTGTFFKLCLFGVARTPPSTSEIERVVTSAMKLFMAGYGAQKNPLPAE